MTNIRETVASSSSSSAAAAAAAAAIASLRALLLSAPFVVASHQSACWHASLVYLSPCSS